MKCFTLMGNSPKSDIEYFSSNIKALPISTKLQQMQEQIIPSSYLYHSDFKRIIWIAHLSLLSSRMFQDLEFSGKILGRRAYTKK